VFVGVNDFDDGHNKYTKPARPMGGPTAPVAYHGKFIVPSGWGMLQYMPGNVLLVFDTK
jgi:hypothetical protein